MYPSEKAWKGVYSSLHTKKRWYIAGMSLLVTGIILVAGKELILSSPHSGPLKKQALTASLTTPKTTPDNPTLPAPFTEFRGASHAVAGHNGQGSGLSEDSPATTGETNAIGIVDPNATAADGQSIGINNTAAQTTDIIVTGATAMTAKGSSAARSDITGFRSGTRLPGNTVATRPADGYAGYLTRVRTGSGLTVEEDPYAGQLVIMTSFRPENNLAPGLQIPLHPAIAGRSSMTRMQTAELLQSISAADDGDEAETPDAATMANPTQQKVNWLQDYAVYSLHPSPRKSKGYWQIYFAPTDNIRILSGGMAANSKAGIPAITVPQTSTAKNKVSDLLRNMGFEGGGSVLYKISPTLSVKAGLQFNYSKFAINTNAAARDSGFAAGPAHGGGLGSGILHNEYYQLSAPVGLDLKIWGNDRLQVDIAATVQPAYLLNTNSYLLMTDEAGNNNYAQAPGLFRKWNIDGGAGAYISYKVGGLRLQVGPEFRYQFLSSYSSQYPIRENLKEYGLKIGIIKAIR